MDRNEFMMAEQLASGGTLSRVVFCGLVALTVSACASGGGSAPATTATPASTTPAPASAPAPLYPNSAGELERTQFSPSLAVDLTKMVRRPSGLYVQDFGTGTGTVAAQARTAVLRYSGYLSNGMKFDSGEITISIGAGKVIRAWDEGVLGMRVGGKRRLVSPPHLAYGARGAPPAIPPNAVLVFDMELVQVY